MLPVKELIPQDGKCNSGLVPNGINWCFHLTYCQEPTGKRKIKGLGEGLVMLPLEREHLSSRSSILNLQKLFSLGIFRCPAPQTVLAQVEGGADLDLPHQDLGQAELFPECDQSWGVGDAEPVVPDATESL